MTSLSQKGLNIVAILPKFTGTLSFIGSASIIWDIIQKWKVARRTSNELFPISMKFKILLSLSVADLVSSFFGHFLSTWMVPQDTSPEYVALAAGNQATCVVQAVLTEPMMYVSNWSNAMLGIVYWLTLCRKWPQSTLKKPHWQLLLLGFPWSFAIVYTIATWFTPPVGASFRGTVWFCTLIQNEATGILFIASFAIMFVLVIGSMLALVRSVYVVERKMDDYRVESPTIAAAANGNTRTGEGLVHSLGLSHRQRTIQVANQGIWYALAFMSFWIVSFIQVLHDNLGDENLSHWFRYIFAFVVPLQGFLNAIVYHRPAYLANREKKRRQQAATDTTATNSTEQSPTSARSLLSAFSFGHLFQSSQKKKSAEQPQEAKSSSQKEQDLREEESGEPEVVVPETARLSLNGAQLEEDQA